MNLPETLSNAQSWTVIGPMGPKLSENLSAFPVLAVDGGANFSEKIDVWTGDHDSLKTKISCHLQWPLKPEKNLSDLAAAFRILSTAKASTFHLWGFLGGRLDHELFNLGEAVKFLSDRAGHKLIFYNHLGKEAIQIYGSGRYQINHSGLFSLATLTPTEIKLTGQCRYQIPESTNIFSLSSFGLSNIGEGIFELETTGPAMIIYSERT